jgi:hypothetical protein
VARLKPASSIASRRAASSGSSSSISPAIASSTSGCPVCSGGARSWRITTAVLRTGSNGSTDAARPWSSISRRKLRPSGRPMVAIISLHQPE